RPSHRPGQVPSPEPSSRELYTRENRNRLHGDRALHFLDSERASGGRRAASGKSYLPARRSPLPARQRQDRQSKLDFYSAAQLNITIEPDRDSNARHDAYEAVFN